MADFAAEGERSPAILPVARFGDGSAVHSVVLANSDGVDHEYWVVRDGRVVAKCWLPCTSGGSNRPSTQRFDSLL